MGCKVGCGSNCYGNVVCGRRCQLEKLSTTNFQLEMLILLLSILTKQLPKKTVRALMHSQYIYEASLVAYKDFFLLVNCI